MLEKYKIDVQCSCCGDKHRRRKYDVKDQSNWMCKPCVTAERNKALSRPDGAVRTHLKSGYLEEKSNGEWRRQHILVMERSIGRRLTLDEVVHHRNEVKTDNRIENLQLMTNGEHTALHSTGKTFTTERKKNISEAVRQSGRSKITTDSILWIRERAKEGMMSRESIAIALGVSKSAVVRVISDKSWRY